MIDKLIELLERFFLDVVGSIVPGALLIGGLTIVSRNSSASSLLSNRDLQWWIWLPVSYVAGHFLTAVGDRFTVPILRWVYTLPHLASSKKVFCIWPVFSADPAPPNYLRSRTELANRPSVKLLRKQFPALADLDPSDTTGISSLRNVALTLVPSDQRSTTIRFTAIALFSLGISTTSVILMISLIVREVLFNPAPNYADLAGIALAGIWFMVLMMKRYFEFLSRSQYLPFDMLVASVATRTIDETRSTHGEGSEPPNGPEKVYLSGGHRSRWQDTVKLALPQFAYFDPSLHALADARAYTTWDLAAIAKSKIVFAYLEMDNPSGIGLALELGYARALGKIIILVDAVSHGDPKRANHLRIVRACASVVLDTLVEGIDFLKANDPTTG